MSLTLAQASTILDVALKVGREARFEPLTVAVLDAGGHLVALKREDGSGILRVEIAYGKAWGALGMAGNAFEWLADAETGKRIGQLAREVPERLDKYDLSGALEAIWIVVRSLNRYVEEHAPWQLAKDEATTVSRSPPAANRWARHVRRRPRSE